MNEFTELGCHSHHLAPHLYNDTTAIIESNLTG